MDPIILRWYLTSYNCFIGAYLCLIRERHSHMNNIPKLTSRLIGAAFQLRRYIWLFVAVKGRVVSVTPMIPNFVNESSQ